MNTDAGARRFSTRDQRTARAVATRRPRRRGMRVPLGPYPRREPDAPAHAVRDRRPRIVQRRRLSARLHAVGGLAADRAARARGRHPARGPRTARRLPDRRGPAARPPRGRRAARAREGAPCARRAVVDAGDPPARGGVPDRDGHDRRARGAQLRRGAGRRLGPGPGRRAGRRRGSAGPAPGRRRGALRLRADGRRGRRSGASRSSSACRPDTGSPRPPRSNLPTSPARPGSGTTAARGRRRWSSSAEPPGSPRRSARFSRTTTPRCRGSSPPTAWSA